MRQNSGEKEYEGIEDYFVPCINTGLGENVTKYLRGHANWHLKYDGQGRLHFTWQYTDRGSYAIGRKQMYCIEWRVQFI